MPLPEERFTDRADDYARHRPGYPGGIVGVLQKECGLNSESSIADIAAGTGLLTEVFLNNGNRVQAKEPNAAMLTTLKKLEPVFRGLQCRRGSAEATGLAPASMDFVTVGQAMHWFDLGRTKQEFARILRPGGWCVVVYNERRRAGDAFHEGYEQLLRTYGNDYQEVQDRHLKKESIAGFFHPCNMTRVTMDNVQTLTLDGLRGRIASSSYMPTRESPQYELLQKDIAELFAGSQKDGLVNLGYVCALTFGQLHCP